jgi:hypothetical protein
MTTSSKQDFFSIAAAGPALAPIKFGLGGVPFGNEFEVVSDEDAYKTLEAAWNAGVRYYDVAPWYGLAERRYGNFLHNKSRDGYVLSSKVGKLLEASPHNNHRFVIERDAIARSTRYASEDESQRGAPARDLRVPACGFAATLTRFQFRYIDRIGSRTHDAWLQVTHRLMGNTDARDDWVAATNRE